MGVPGIFARRYARGEVVLESHDEARWRILIASWLLVVLGGLYGLMRYKATPTAAGATPRHWPAAAQLTRQPARPTLVMFAHPKCPCTRASVEELRLLMQHERGRVTAHVVFVVPPGAPADFAEGDLWRQANAIDGVNVVADIGGGEARRFAALSSGFTVAYDGGGALIYAGGITSARGHIGDNLGQARLVARLDGKATDREDAPVFGCALFEEGP
jgi:hypothetical protein